MSDSEEANKKTDSPDAHLVAGNIRTYGSNQAQDRELTDRSSCSAGGMVA